MFRSVRARAPWLLVNLGTAVIASWRHLARSKARSSQLVALAVLMPIVASMGGNAGTQTLAVAVRAIASRELTESNAPRYVMREVMTAVSNGLIFASCCGGGGHVVRERLVAGDRARHSDQFACAGLAGILVPLTLRRFGADPAVSSSVFVTFVTDMVGFLAFLGLATLILLS